MVKEKHDPIYGRKIEIENSLDEDRFVFTLEDPPNIKKKPKQVPQENKGNIPLSILFSLEPLSAQLKLIIPATVLTIIISLAPAFMTRVTGAAFAAFAEYNAMQAQGIATAENAQHMKKAIVKATIELLCTAAVILFCSTTGTFFWVAHGERTVRILRLRVFTAITSKSLSWFDTRPEDAGALLGQFTKETDDVRMGCSQSLGQLMQYTLTFIVCLVTSLVSSYKLTFVILASFPIILFIVSITERHASPLTTRDREIAASVASCASRVFSALATVKSFGAQQIEQEAFDKIGQAALRNYIRLHFFWGLRAGATQFLLLAMFVQGFWFGSYLITSGQNTTTQVTTCFWSCLMATSYLQMCVPVLITIEKGKSAMYSLKRLSEEENEQPRTAEIRDFTEAEMDSFSPHSDGSPTYAMDPFADLYRAQDVSPTSPYADTFKPAPLSTTFGSPTSPKLSRLPSSARRPKYTHKRQLSSASTDSQIQLMHSQRIRTGTQINRSNSSASQRYYSIPIQASSSPNSKLRAFRRGGSSRVVKPLSLRKIVPAFLDGEIALRNVTFAYPSRPNDTILKNVSLYLPPQETTFIVGTSGSGKSTVASLILGLYSPATGDVMVDDQEIGFLDMTWLRSQIACVSQGAGFTVEGTVHDNIAIAATEANVDRSEVIAACRTALLHEFIVSLPEGYDTYLGSSSGVQLSGGQMQRLAIARAVIRNPNVLLLDEATSALDPTSRTLVLEAIKRWRLRKTTIIITHDFSQITPEDFVYVMEHGRVAENGYRRDLEKRPNSLFYRAAFEPIVEETEEQEDHDFEMVDAESEDELEAIANTNYKRHSTGGMGYLDVASIQTLWKRNTNQISLAPLRHSVAKRHSEIQVFGDYECIKSASFDEEDLKKIGEMAAESRAGAHTRESREKEISKTRTGSFKEKLGARKRHSNKSNKTKKNKNGKMETHDASRTSTDTSAITPSLFRIMAIYHHTLPRKVFFYLGLVISVGVGACTPIFSSLLSQLMSSLGNPTKGNSVVRISLLVLMLAFFDGLGTFVKFILMEICAMSWTTSLREDHFRKILAQDKAWFDRAENQTPSLVHLLTKDTEDSRIIIGTYIGQYTVVLTMTLMSLLWAFAVGWKMTLVGMGIMPVFAILTRIQTNILTGLEAKNKHLREDVSRQFFKIISSIKKIRCMSLEKPLYKTFTDSVEATYLGALKAAWMAGSGYGTAQALMYCAEALLFFVGAVFIENGTYTFADVLQVLTLIIFSVTFASAIMNQLPGMTKSLRAAADFTRILNLSMDTTESGGELRPTIVGNVSFQNVSFAYPTRPDMVVLPGITLEVKRGECVGIVGPSGSGKSTIVSILQRFYEPTKGRIMLDNCPLRAIDVQYLRRHIGVVSQQPTLFNMSVAENIAYGLKIEDCKPEDREKDVERSGNTWRSRRHTTIDIPGYSTRTSSVNFVTMEKIISAAKRANVHDFIESLPKGYATLLRDDASLISGGQAQRIQIARCLVLEKPILILDECTSALDPANQRAVMDTIVSTKVGRTTLIVTHKLDMMNLCDRLIVLNEEGCVAEMGDIKTLLSKPGGYFAQLARGGEWEGA